MAENQSLLASIVQVGGGLLITFVSLKYGPVIARKSRRKSNDSEAQVILRLQRSIQKRDKTIQYLDRKVIKEEKRIAQLKILNEQLRVANEKEMLYIEQLQQRVGMSPEGVGQGQQP